MNSTPDNSLSSESSSGSGEETLRLIASLPAPEGLEDRVHESLRAARCKGRVLAWPESTRSSARWESGWMRTAAAAAIVFVVVGGGWGVYTRVQPGHPAKVIVMPSHVPATGGFSGAGAIRTPETLPGPTVNQPAEKAPAPAKRPRKPAAPAAKPTVLPLPSK